MGYVFAALASILWGLVYTLNQKLLVYLSPVQLSALHGIGTLIVTLPLLLITPAEAKDTAVAVESPFPYALVFVVTTMSALAGLCILASIQYLDATRASFFEISYPLFVCIFSALIFSQRISLGVALGALLMLAGAIVIVRTQH
jgi:drug/metabolite transporter (DMT)-like permease